MKSDMHFSLFLSSLMQLFDTDEDERITREEFTALLRSALGVSDLNMAKLFKEIDADGSGFITFSEYTLPLDIKLHFYHLTSFCFPRGCWRMGACTENSV